MRERERESQRLQWHRMVGSPVGRVLMQGASNYLSLEGILDEFEQLLAGIFVGRTATTGGQ